MKNKIFRIAIALCSCIVATSCNDSEPDTEHPFFPEKTLAGTISFVVSYYIKDAEGTFDGKTLEDLQKQDSKLLIREYSDTKVSIYCRTMWGEETITIQIPVIPISGEPYNVSFDYVSNMGEVTISDEKRVYIPTSVKGWVKEDTKGETRDSPAILDYLCDITIETSFDNKPLKIRIKKIDTVSLNRDRNKTEFSYATIPI